VRRDQVLDRPQGVEVSSALSRREIVEGKPERREGGLMAHLAS